MEVALEMFVLGMPAAIAAAALHYAGPVGTAATRMRDGIALASAIDGTQLDFWRQSIGATVEAHAIATESGCATAISSQPPGRPNNWSRMLRWDQIAWTGALADGRVMVAFFEHDGRLPGDRVTFAPADPTAFRDVVERVAQACRTHRAQDERVIVSDYPTWRSCYFARMPALELVEVRSIAGWVDKPRASMSVYARETPEAELHLLFEGSWNQPEVSFTIAGHELRRKGIAGAKFALDGAPVTPQHSLAAYGDTRLRIRMDPFRTPKPEPAAGEPAYFARLIASGVATLTLLDESGAGAGSLTFDVGPALAAARDALEATPWTCAASSPARPAAAQWHLAE